MSLVCSKSAGRMRSLWSGVGMRRTTSSSGCESAECKERSAGQGPQCRSVPSACTAAFVLAIRKMCRKMQSVVCQLSVDDPRCSQWRRFYASKESVVQWLVA